MTTKNKFRHHNYINLPDEVKSNYEGQFPSNFTDKVTELWEQSSERTGYQGKTISFKTHENSLRQIIIALVENELNDYKERVGKYERFEKGLRRSHSPLEEAREQNTLKAFRSMFEWEEEYMVSRDIEVCLTQETYFAKSWQDNITKEQVRKFNEGVLSYEDIVGEDDNSIIQHAQSEGEFDVEVYEGENNMGGVRIWSIKLRDKFLPFIPELHEEEKVEK